MEKFKGTKGIWSVEPLLDGSKELMILDEDGYQLASSTGEYKGGLELATHNANLIASFLFMFSYPLQNRQKLQMSCHTAERLIYWLPHQALRCAVRVRQKYQSGMVAHFSFPLHVGCGRIHHLHLFS